MNTYRARFESFNDPIFKAMLWMNPANWDISNPKYGLSHIRFVGFHFKTPLNESNFSIENIDNEWKSFKRLCTRNYPNIKSPLAFWQRILTYHGEEFSNVCLIGEICLTIEVSNSTVERGFSKLTHFLTDKRFSMSHISMENCLLIAANSTCFNEQEKAEIIKDATSKYLKKRRRTASYARKIPLVSEECSDDGEDHLEEVEAAAAAVTHDYIPDEDCGDSHEDDTMHNDISSSENSD